MKQILQKIAHRKIPPWLIFTTIIIAAVMLRFYKLSDTILFSHDQGLDMTSIWLMGKTGNFPLIGPFLSLPDVHTPPTYYLINWAMYSLTHSVTKMVYGYALLNLFTVLILIKLTHAMMGPRAAIFAGILMAVSNVMIDHSRTFWQPYPIQFFLALSLLFFWWAYESKRVLFLLAAVLCYQTALSIYPSPILLAPFVCYHTFRWYHRNTHKTPVTSVLLTLLTLSATFIVVYFPQLIYEATHEFPTIISFIISDTDRHMIHPIMSVLQNAYLLTTAFFAIDRLPGEFMIAVTIAICTLYAILIYVTHAKRSKHIDSFFPLWTFIIGFCIFLFYPYEAHRHRSMALLPFMFLSTAYLLNRAWIKNSTTKLLAIIVLLIFISLNVQGAQWYWSETTPNDLNHTKRIAAFIHTDMEKRGITDTSAGFFYKIPNDPDNGSYGIYRILFWLIRDGKLSLSFDTENIHTPHDYSVPILKPYMYIICHNFYPTKTTIDHCIKPVIQSAKYRQLAQKVFDDITVVILSGRLICEVPRATHE